MPELPEVETVARDLRPRLVGATIVGARSSWARTLRTHAPDAFAAAVAGRTVEAVGRRAKLVVVELSGSVALTIHLKMTGQLFVVPADLPVDPYVRLILELADGRELRFRDIRKFGRVGLYPRDAASGELLTEPGGAAVFAGHGPEPLDEAFTLRAFRARLRNRAGRLKPLLLDQGFIAGIGNIYADEALWAARLHPLRSAISLRPADERRLHLRDPLDPHRGGRAARLLDRRLHGARRRRLDAGAPERLPADRRAVPALRPADPPDRHRRPGQPLLLVVPAPVGGRSHGRAPDPGDHGDATGSGAAAWSPLDRAGRRRGAGADRRRGGPCRGQGAFRTDQASGRRTTGPGAAGHDTAGKFGGDRRTAGGEA